MKKGVFPFLALISIFSFPPLEGQDQAGGFLAGSWLGELSVGAAKLRIVFNIAWDGKRLSATMDSPDQGAKGIPVSKIEYSDGKLLLEVKAAAGKFEGALEPPSPQAANLTVDPGRSEVSARARGAWSQGGKSFPLDLKKLDSPFAMNRPQEPKAPFPYMASEVKFRNAKAKIDLAGTLTLPKGKGPFPSVVLVSGSGAQNRDEEIFGHKPFAVIADSLSRNGVAVLRYDDRGVGSSKGDFSKATSLDLADDAEAAFDYLLSRKEVDPGRAGIIGHSEGGLIAPIIACRNDSVGFIILLAGPGIRGRELLLLQNAALLRAEGTDEARIQSMNGINAALYDIAMGKDSPERLLEEAKKSYAIFIDSESSLSAAEKSEALKDADASLSPLATPWFRAFLSLDPGPFLEKTGCPVLALNGSLDLQVPAKENLGAISAALGRGGNARATIRELPGLNHLFQHCATGKVEEYGAIEETVSPEVLSFIGDFIAKR